MKFFSNDDEELFFDWINKIKCIKSYKGIGSELHLEVVDRSMTFDEFRNLYGIFKRYNLDNPQQIKTIFGNTDNQDWFDGLI